MFTRYTVFIIVVFLIGALVTSADWGMVRLNQNGDIIDGPIIPEYGSSNLCEISDSGYIYYQSWEAIGIYGKGKSTTIYVYNSSLDFINSVYSPTFSLSIDNVRQEIVAGQWDTITRFGSTLNELDTFDIDGNVHGLTVDQDDGAIWYTSFYPPIAGLFKLAHDGTEIYSDENGYYGIFTDVSPIGSFWLTGSTSKALGNPRLFDSDGTYRAEANITTHGLREVLEMHFNSEACWMITDVGGIAKANSSGTIVYNNSADFYNPSDLAVNQDDGSVWIADRANYEVVHLDSSGGELLRKKNNWTPDAVAVDPSDGSVIVIYWDEENSIESSSLGKIKATFATEEMIKKQK